MMADIDLSVAEIEEAYGIDLTDPTPPIPASLQAAQTLIETLWSVSRLLVSRGSAAEGAQKTRESLKQLLGSEDPASVQQGLVLLRAIDDPQLWADFAEGLTSDLTIGGMIKGWVQPSHQLNVARFVALHAGLLEGVTELNVTAAVHELGRHALGGPLSEFISADARQPHLAVRVSPGSSTWERLKEEPRLTSLSLEGFSKLDELAGLPQLTRLSISDARFLRDIGVLRQLSALTAVELRELESLTDISVLTELPALTSLKLHACKKLRDIQPLLALASLTALELSHYKTPDLKALGALSNLRRLTLYGCRATRTFKPLQELPQLTELVLGGGSGNMNVRSLRGLEGLTQLTRLHLSGFQILRDIEALEGLTGLTELKIFDGYIKDLSSLSALTRLQRLHISSPVSDLSPLHGLTGLTALKLTKAKVTAADIRALQAALPELAITHR